LLREKPVQAILAFVLLAFLAWNVPSPWWEGRVLQLRPNLPDPSGNFFARQTEQKEVEQEVAEVDLDDTTSSSTTESADGPRGQEASEQTTGAGAAKSSEPEPSESPWYWNTPSQADLRLLDKIETLESKLDKPPVELERPCLSFAPEHRAVSWEPLCMQRALDSFYRQLRATALGEAERPARLSQFGDSLIAGDAFTGELRRLLQDQFGEGGFGYIHVGKASRFIGTRHLTVQTSEEWKRYTVIDSNGAGTRFGFAGAAFEPDGRPRLGVFPHGEGTARSYDRVGLLLYRGRDHRVRVSIDGEGRNVDLSGPSDTNVLHWIDAEPGVHDLRIAGFSPGNIYYGVVLEHAGPGVVVDNLGMASSRAPRLTLIDREQWQAQIRKRAPDVVSFAYGVNTAGEQRASQSWLEDYRDQYETVLRRARGASSEVDCLVLSLLTRAGRNNGTITTYPSVEPLVRTQREAARSSECAFWNTHEAFGGADGARQWYNNRPRLLGSDFAHPTMAGYKKLANLFYASLIEGFRRYLEERIRRTRLPHLRGSHDAPSTIF
jgi:lysophospholipase L1-like esterase